MFGYVTVNQDALSDAEKRRFRAFYCGLCHALNVRHGATSCLTLSYDMTFLALLLTSLYEPETTLHTARCVPHPSKRHEYCQNVMIDYAADMTVALAYQKALDDWQDDKNLLALTGARITKPRYSAVKARFPEQVKHIETGLKTLSEVEKSGNFAIDPPVNAFGELLGPLFVYKKDYWSDTLCQMGAGIGRFIYLMDAYDDLSADMRAGKYNPLSGIRDEPDFEARVKSFLTLLIADATDAFETLPLVNDLPILRNILYSGVWTKYETLRRKRVGKGGKA